MATGRVVFSNDFEQNNINGFSRSPGGLPEDRVQIVDDPRRPAGQGRTDRVARGRQLPHVGRNRAAQLVLESPGERVPPGTNVSHAFGIMFNQADTNYAFGQVISSGGPVWMLILEGSGTLTVFCNTCGGNTRHMTLEPKKWYDFRVDMDFRVGGAVRFS
jgi:hypothetical protein